MLSKEDNEILTRTGPDTPMGELFRRYWIPFMVSEELPHPDCLPVKVKLLSEELIAFRDTNGRVGLIDEYCPHRLVSLSFAQSEGCGLRCAYHGWKFDIEGNCMDMPSEPPDNDFKQSVKIKSYPCEERGGVIWAYMGSAEEKPPMPEQEWMMVPDGHRFVTKRLQECNYLQALEGAIDSSHASILHSGSIGGIGTSKGTGGAALLVQDTHPKFEVDDTDYGLLIGARRDVDDEQYYWRITQFLMPWYTMIPPFKGAPRGGHAYTPIDDHHCWTWTWTWHSSKPLSEEELEREQEGWGIHADLIPGTYRPVANKDNNYLRDPEMIRNGQSFVGIKGLGMEDQAVQESAGPIVDRSRERLGTSDTAIIKARRALLKAAKALEEGIKAPALDPKSHHIRAASLLLPKEIPFKEGAKEMMKLTADDYISL